MFQPVLEGSVPTMGKIGESTLSALSNPWTMGTTEIEGGMLMKQLGSSACLE